METIFTRLLSQEIPGVILYEDEHVFAFMDAGQVNPGHVLVATRHPYETLMDVDEATVIALMRLTQKMARAIDQAFQPDGITILQANRSAGWQTVPHVHFHVVPRYKNDGAELVWPRHDPAIEELREHAEKIVL
ncbi:MAG TPA: HIT family protein [Burkholderiaceae bacterium]|nr:HIT family protein [Burkholderiaceae bacterium]